MVFLKSYGKASGQNISLEKSSFFCGRYAASRKSIIQSILGCNEGDFPFTYLGVPIFKGQPKRCHFQGLMDRVKSKLEGWMGKLLSMAGRVQLVQSVVQAMLLHSFMIYKWPLTLLKRVMQWIRNFIWSGDLDKRKLVTISWDTICLPKSEGGLGLRNLIALNKAALLKFTWNTFQRDTPWRRFFHGRFHFNVFSITHKYVCSSILPGIRDVFSAFKSNCRWIIGDGSSIHFWYDKWLNNPIVEMIGLFSGLDLHLRVASFIQDKNELVAS